MKNFLMKLNNGMNRFMQGRYGNDKLNLTVLVLALVLNIVSAFIRVPVLSAVISLLSMGLLALCIYRTFSRNIRKRYEEEAGFERLLNRLKDMKTHHIYKCPACRQKIRIPRKKGVKAEITCPKCHTKFTKKI